MKAPISDGPDYLWASNECARIAGQVYNSSDPNNFLDSLPTWESRLFYLVQGVSKILNGGIDGYLCGSSGDEIEPLSNALNYIGAHDTFNTIKNVKELFPGHIVPTNYYERMKSIDAILHHKQTNRIDDLVDVIIDNDIWKLIREHCQPI
jgi:hypothetical protein